MLDSKTVKSTFTTFSHGPKKMEMFTDRSLIRNTNFQLVALRASSQRNVFVVHVISSTVLYCFHKFCFGQCKFNLWCTYEVNLVSDIT